MALKAQSQIRDFVTQRLRMRGDLAPLDDKELLFTHGRLDSLDAIEIVMFLESFGIDFSAINFDLTLLDSVSDMSDLVERHDPGA